MAKSVVREGVQKLRALRPSRIRKEAHRVFQLQLHGATEWEREALGRVFLPENLDEDERRWALGRLAGNGHGGALLHAHTPGLAAPGVEVDPEYPEPGLIALLRANPGYRLALGRAFPVLRQLLARELIQAVAARNAAIAAISALPDVIPTPLSLLLALGEMGSDTILITANQLGLGFELAALRGEEVGWRAQSGTALGVMLAALGWRTLARELVGMIPAGIGLAAKSGIAYSGTIAVGTAMWKSSQRAGDSTKVRSLSAQRRIAAINQAEEARLATQRQTA